MMIYLPGGALSFFAAYAFNKKFPTAPTGMYRLRKFLKVFSVYSLGMMTFCPILFRFFQSNDLGEEVRASLIKHSNQINSPNFNKFL